MRDFLEPADLMPYKPTLFNPAVTDWRDSQNKDSYVCHNQVPVKGQPCPCLPISRTTGTDHPGRLEVKSLFTELFERQVPDQDNSQPTPWGNRGLDGNLQAWLDQPQLQQLQNQGQIPHGEVSISLVGRRESLLAERTKPSWQPKWPKWWFSSFTFGWRVQRQRPWTCGLRCMELKEGTPTYLWQKLLSYLPDAQPFVIGMWNEKLNWTTRAINMSPWFFAPKKKRPNHPTETRITSFGRVPGCSEQLECTSRPLVRGIKMHFFSVAWWHWDCRACLKNCSCHTKCGSSWRGNCSDQLCRRKSHGLCTTWKWHGHDTK